MKYRSLMFASAFLASVAGMAQNPYMNEKWMPTDISGTARYVGMGGALGALGADLSAGANNPASMALFRRSDVSLSFSVLSQKDFADVVGDKNHMSFDQMGFVFSTPIMADNLKYINFGVNYQKRANFNNAFIADGDTRGLSQTGAMADILNYTQYSTPLADLMYNSCLVNPVYERDEAGVVVRDDEGNAVIKDKSYTSWRADRENYSRVTEGGIMGYDFNLSMNFNDRIYVGLAMGVNDVDYHSNSVYSEFDEQGELYSLYNTHSVDGYGFNGQFGVIVRPFEFSPFRVGLSVETPTFYHLESRQFYSIDSPFSEDENCNIVGGEYVNYNPEYDLDALRMRIRTPWKVKASLGNTFDKYLAVGLEYEYAHFGKIKQEYQDWGYDDWGGEYYGDAISDRNMDDLHEAVLKAMHTLRLGMEVNVTDNFAFRLGYNYMSKMFKKDAALDQANPSPAFGYQTSTAFMNKGDVNILTAGIGYHGKHFYADMAYKYRQQKAGFLAFDDYYIRNDEEYLTPIDVDLSSHQVFFTLGYKF